MRLSNFLLDTTEEVNPEALTDEQAIHYLPQHVVAQSCYQLLRAKGNSILEAMTDILMIQLMSGGQRKFIHVRDGGRA